MVRTQTAADAAINKYRIIVTRSALQPFLYGTLAGAGLLALYFIVVSLVSGGTFAREQFAEFWYFILALAAGFGIQAGLYVYTRRIVAEGNKAMLCTTGATSAAAMVSCCSHYLVNLVPLLGAAGFVALIGQYQIELFWAGIVLNLFGIVYSIRNIIRFKRHLS